MKKLTVLVLGLTVLWTNHGYSMDDDLKKEHQNTSVLHKSGGAQLSSSENSEEENSSQSKTTATLDPIFWSVEERVKYVGIGVVGGGCLGCGIFWALGLF